MSQTSITQNTPKAAPGLIADIGFNDFLSRLAHEAIAFGKFVRLDGEAKCRLPGEAAHVTGGLRGGFAVRDLAREQTLAGVTEYKEFDAVSIMRKGRVWVTVEDAVAVGGAVFIRVTTVGGDTVGNVRSDADTDMMVDRATQLAGAKFLTDAGAGELAQVEFDLL